MQRKLIVLAIAGLASGTAMAQTNVTTYGIADLGYVYSRGSAGTGLGTNKFSGIANGITAGNRLGFKGEEALGNGLKAVFTLEYGLNLDTNQGIGTGGLNARQQYVGLAGRFGKVALGRQYGPGFNAAANNDALDATDMAIQSSLSVYAGNTITPNSPSRFNNAISYTSNPMGGLTVSAIYGFGESNYGGLGVAHPTDNGRIGLGLNYASGPLNLDAVYQSRQHVVEAYPTPVDTGRSVNEWYLGGSWDFKVVKAYASYQALKNNNSGVVSGAYGNPAGTAIAAKNHIWTAGLTAPIGPGTLGLSYGQLKLNNSNFVGQADGKTWGWGTMYTYPLSKRTALYAAYTYFNNDHNSIAVQTQVAADGGGIGVVGESNHDR